MGRSSTLPSDDLALSMDVHQQVDKTTRPLYSVSGRRAAIAGFHPLRVFPRRNQDVRGDDTECGMYVIFPPPPLVAGKSMASVLAGWAKRRFSPSPSSPSWFFL